MTLQINIGDHTSSEADYLPVPPNLREPLRWARTRALQLVNHNPGANLYFSGLPGGRSLGALLQDRTIWINYAPTLSAYGETNMVGGKEIAIGPMAFRIGRWTVLATLIHELAHSNGAPGGTDHRAEQAVYECGMGRLGERSGSDDPRTPYDPSIGG
jgi:hypothetical protein